MLFNRLKKGWEARLALLGVSAKDFCEGADISYSTWLQMYNPPIGLCDKIEAELQKLEA